MALGGKEKLVFERVEDDADHHSLLDGQGDGDAGEGEAVHEVGGACLCISIFGRLGGLKRDRSIYEFKNRVCSLYG